jgi:hypothetical protein
LGQSLEGVWLHRLQLLQELIGPVLLLLTSGVVIRTLHQSCFAFLAALYAVAAFRTFAFSWASVSSAA